MDGVAKRDREQAPSVKVCPQCFATSPSQSQVCSDCGHEFRAEVRELKVVDGELKELAVTKRREQGSARDLQSLRELAKQRGYKPGWAERVYQARLTRAN